MVFLLLRKGFFYYLKINNGYEFIPKNWYRNGSGGLYYFGRTVLDYRPDFLTKNLCCLYCYLFVLCMHLFYAVCLAVYPFWAYYEGFANFIKNDVWQNNVRLFNWVNFICCIFTALYLIYKIYG